jgi:hypothetical protein
VQGHICHDIQKQAPALALSPYSILAWVLKLPCIIIGKKASTLYTYLLNEFHTILCTLLIIMLIYCIYNIFCKAHNTAGTKKTPYFVCDYICMGGADLKHRTCKLSAEHMKRLMWDVMFIITLWQFWSLCHTSKQLILLLFRLHQIKRVTKE